MFLAFHLRARGSAAGQQSRVISGTQWEVVVTQDKADGPYYPQVSEEENANYYRFFAGRVVGHDSNTVPEVAPFSHSGAGDPDGSWIALEFDKVADTLKIASDVFNVQRWFFYRDGSGWILANSLRYLYRVAITKPAIDERAVHYMLRMGYLPEPFTPLRDVQSVGNGMQLEISRGEATLVERSTLPVQRRDLRAVSEHGEHIAQVLIDEVAREIHGVDHLWIPLSGGVDSRFLLACALQALDHEAISTVTFGSGNSLDARIGSAVAKECGVRNYVLPMDGRPLNEVLDQNFAVSEGLYWTVPDYPVGSFNTTLPAHSIALSGYIGDPVFGSKEGKLSIHEAVAGRDEERVKYFWKSGTYVPIDTVTPLLDMREEDPLNIREIFRKIHGQTMMESFDFWYFGQHSVNRTLFAVTPARRNVFYVMPFISRAVLDTAFAIPSELRERQRAYFSALKARFPDFYAFPTTRNHGFPIEDRYSLHLILTRFRRRMMRELDERLGGRFGIHLYHNPRSNYAHPRELLRRKHRDDVIAGLERLHALPVMRKEQLEHVKARVARGYGVDPLLLRGLLTVSQWIKVYRKEA